MLCAVDLIDHDFSLHGLQDGVVSWDPNNCRE